MNYQNMIKYVGLKAGLFTLTEEWISGKTLRNIKNDNGLSNYEFKIFLKFIRKQYGYTKSIRKLIPEQFLYNTLNLGCTPEEVAKLLHVTERTIYNRIKEYGMGDLKYQNSSLLINKKKMNDLLSISVFFNIPEFIVPLTLKEYYNLDINISMKNIPDTIENVFVDRFELIRNSLKYKSMEEVAKDFGVRVDKLRKFLFKEGRVLTWMI